MNYLVLDLETTGVDILVDAPVQLAMALYEGLVPYAKWERVEYIKLLPGATIHPKAMEVHGITPEKLDTIGVAASVLAKDYHSAVWESLPITLVGYNLINFDFPMLQNWLARVVQGPFKFPPITSIEDVMFMACNYFKTRKWPKLKDAATKFEIPFDEKLLHDALADIRLTWAVYREIKEREIREATR